MMMNRNKRGIAVDLKTEGGKTILRRLVADVDILIENFRPGTLDRLGVGYDTLKESNPGLIYGSHFGLRPDRSLPRAGRVRPRGPGHERTDEHHRRRVGPHADQSGAPQSRISPPGCC